MRHMNATLFTRTLLSASALALVLAAIPVSFAPSGLAVSKTFAFAKGGGSVKAGSAATDPNGEAHQHADHHGAIAGKRGAPNTADTVPDSRVGRIAAYVDAVGRTIDLKARATALEEVIARLEETQLRDEERAALEARLNGDITDEEHTALESQLAADAEAQARIKATTEKLEAIDAEIAEASQAEAEALEAAANKEVTDEVVAAVNDLLGIESTATGGTEAAEPTDTTQVTQ